MHPHLPRWRWQLKISTSEGGALYASDDQRGAEGRFERDRSRFNQPEAGITLPAKLRWARPSAFSLKAPSPGPDASAGQALARGFALRQALVSAAPKRACRP